MVAGTSVASVFGTENPYDADDLTRAVQILAQYGYDGNMTPDHPVNATGDTTGGMAYWAFVFGIISASMKAAERQLNS